MVFFPFGSVEGGVSWRERSSADGDGESSIAGPCRRLCLSGKGKEAAREPRGGDSGQRRRFSRRNKKKKKRKSPRLIIMGARNDTPNISAATLFRRRSGICSIRRARRRRRRRRGTGEEGAWRGGKLSLSDSSLCLPFRQRRRDKGGGASHSGKYRLLRVSEYTSSL